MQQITKEQAFAVDCGNPEFQESAPANTPNTPNPQFLPIQTADSLQSGHRRCVNVLVKHVPLPRDVTHILDAPPNRLNRQVMHGSRLRYHILLNHQATHVVGSK